MISRTVLILQNRASDLSRASGRTGERGSDPTLLGRSNICDSSFPNSCFRSGNSLGRVSMMDGCQVRMAASSGALRSWDPGPGVRGQGSGLRAQIARD